MRRRGHAGPPYGRAPLAALVSSLKRCPFVQEGRQAHYHAVGRARLWAKGRLRGFRAYCPGLRHDQVLPRDDEAIWRNPDWLYAVAPTNDVVPSSQAESLMASV